MKTLQGKLLIVAVVALAAASCSNATEPLVPGCADPAPLRGVSDPQAPGYIVVFRDDVDAEAEASRLAKKYDFRLDYVYRFAVHGFAAQLSTQALVGVRCEATVTAVDHNGVFRLD